MGGFAVRYYNYKDYCIASHVQSFEDISKLTYAHTVNSDIFTRNISFLKTKPLRNGKLSLPFTDVGLQIMIQSRFFIITNMSFNIFREN